MTVMRWSEAREEGLIRYFTGRQCVHGHVAERFTSGRHCVLCNFARRREQVEQRRRASPNV